MCPHLWQRLGAKFTLCRVLIQQRVSSKLGHVAVRGSLRKEMQNPSGVVRSWRTCSSRARLIKEAEERVAEIREKLKAAQSRQKSYADKKRREISFSPGNFVYLKVSPIRGTRRFQVQGKLAPRYIG